MRQRSGIRNESETNTITAVQTPPSMRSPDLVKYLFIHQTVKYSSSTKMSSSATSGSLKRWKEIMSSDAKKDNTHTHAHTHTHPFNGPFAWTTRVSRYQKGKPIWILLKQETVSGNGVSRAICKSAPHSRQITKLAPHHSVYYRPDALPATQPTASKHWRQSKKR